MMEYIPKNGKDIYIVDSHHEVLEAWVKYPDNNVITFDYHTDTLAACYIWAYKQVASKAKYCDDLTQEEEEQIEPTRLKKIAQYMNNKDIKSAITDLKNDEHLLFAVDTGIVKQVYTCVWYAGRISSKKIFYLNSYWDAYEQYNKYISETMSEDNLLQYHLRDVPITAPSHNNEEIILLKIDSDFLLSCNKSMHDKGCQADADAPNLVLEDNSMQKIISNFSVIEPSICNTPFILDFDMDFFRTCQSLRPATNAVFTLLVQKATAITIAKEDKYCKDVWLDSSPINFSNNLNALMNLIEIACQPST